MNRLVPKVALSLSCLAGGAAAVAGGEALFERMNDGRTSVQDNIDQGLETAQERGFRLDQCTTEIEAIDMLTLSLGHRYKVECTGQDGEPTVVSSGGLYKGRESDVHKFGLGASFFMGAVIAGMAYEGLSVATQRVRSHNS